MWAPLKVGNGFSRVFPKGCHVVSIFSSSQAVSQGSIPGQLPLMISFCLSRLSCRNSVLWRWKSMVDGLGMERFVWKEMAVVGCCQMLPISI